MILTVTMNPSVDISYKLAEFTLDQVNRCDEVSKTAGGKGLNVSRVIHQLAEPVIATGILGGILGEYIKTQLNEQSIQHDFYGIAQESRNCIAILHEGQQTEILEGGPLLAAADGAGYLEKLQHQLETQHPQVVTISGSLPRGLGSDFYTKILDVCHAQNVPVLLDCSGDALEKSLQHQHKPFLIKPNIHELNQLLEEEVAEANLQTVLENELFKNIPWIVISLGSRGAFVKKDDEYYRVTIPKINVINPVGSGDATVGGLAVAIARNCDVTATLQLAMATGMLNTMEERTGWIDATQVPSWAEKVKVEKI